MYLDASGALVSRPSNGPYGDCYGAYRILIGPTKSTEHPKVERPPPEKQKSSAEITQWNLRSAARQTFESSKAMAIIRIIRGP